jgi:hypothetical protein
MAPHFTEALERRVLLSAVPHAATTQQHAGFVTTIDNPYFPLIPGTKFIYKGISDGEREIDRVTVISSYTKTIKGVICTVVLDRVFIEGELTELTHDFYAQDSKGNVWYFGEDTKELENGHITSTEGSFEAGKNGAEGGIIMKANPMVGDSYTQEDAPGVAEDAARVVSGHSRAKTPMGKFDNCLKTEETSALEPDVVEQKYYVKGIGDVKEISTKGENEQLGLWKVIKPGG